MKISNFFKYGLIATSCFLDSLTFAYADTSQTFVVDQNELLGWVAVVSTDELTGDKSAIFLNGGVGDKDFSIIFQMCPGSVDTPAGLSQVFFSVEKDVPLSPGQYDSVLKIRVDDGDIKEIKSIFLQGDVPQAIPVGDEVNNIEKATSDIFRGFLGGKKAVVRIEVSDGKGGLIELNNSFLVGSTAATLKYAHCKLE